MAQQDNFAVSLVKRACPICGKLFDAEIVMTKVLTKKNAENVRNMHGQCVGYMKKPCEDCQKIIDQGAFMVIGIDASKTDDFKNPYRTGHLVGIKKESEFYKNLPEEYKKRDACFMDVNDMKQVGLIQE